MGVSCHVWRTTQIVSKAQTGTHAEKNINGVLVSMSTREVQGCLAETVHRVQQILVVESLGKGLDLILSIENCCGLRR